MGINLATTLPDCIFVRYQFITLDESEKLGPLVYDRDIQVIMNEGNLQTVVLVFCSILSTIGWLLRGDGL